MFGNRPHLSRSRWMACLSALTLGLLMVPSLLLAADAVHRDEVRETDEDAREKLRSLEQHGPKAKDSPAEGADSEAPSRALERLQELERRQEDERREEKSQLGPRERARREIDKLEHRQAPDSSIEGAVRKKKTPKAAAPATPPERVRYLLGVYESLVGIYDEILDRTKVPPGLLHRGVGAPSWLVIGGEHRTRYEGIEGSWRPNEPTSGDFLSHRTRLQVGVQNILDPVRFLMEIQDSRGSLYTTGAYITPNHVDELDIQQLHVDLVSRNFLRTGMPSVLKIGRINMDLGRGRWVGRNQFRNATNAFDGMEWLVGDERVWHLRSFLVQPVQRLVRRLDPWNAPLVGEEKATFWGLYVETRQYPWMETTVHYFGHASDGPHREFNMLGGRVRKRQVPGAFDYEIESSYQFGDINAEARFAHFQHAELGYTFDVPWRPQLLLKFDYASRGNDILYGRRSFELHPTGIFGPFQRSNLIYPGYRVLVSPDEYFYVFLQHRMAWLADSTGSWVGTGFRDETGAAGSFVGHIFEVRARWGVSENVFLQAGYAHFAFGRFGREVPGSPVDRDAHYGYLWTEFMF